MRPTFLNFPVVFQHDAPHLWRCVRRKQFRLSSANSRLHSAGASGVRTDALPGSAGPPTALPSPSPVA